MFLTHRDGSFSTILSDAVAEIDFNMVVGFEIEFLFKPFAKRAVHGEVIGTMLNIIDKGGIVEN